MFYIKEKTSSIKQTIIATTISKQTNESMLRSNSKIQTLAPLSVEQCLQLEELYKVSIFFKFVNFSNILY